MCPTQDYRETSPFLRDLERSPRRQDAETPKRRNAEKKMRGRRGVFQVPTRQDVEMKP
jgi:hypothetical protein